MFSPLAGATFRCINTAIPQSLPAAFERALKAHCALEVTHKASDRQDLGVPREDSMGWDR